MSIDWWARLLTFWCCKGQYRIWWCYASQGTDLPCLLIRHTILYLLVSRFSYHMSRVIISLSHFYKPDIMLGYCFDHRPMRLTAQVLPRDFEVVNFAWTNGAYIFGLGPHTTVDESCLELGNSSKVCNSHSSTIEFPLDSISHCWNVYHPLRGFLGIL